VQKFQTTSNTQQILSPQEIVEALLVEAGTANHLPTDETKLLGFLKLEQLSFDFMNELDFLSENQKQSMDLRAALSFNDRLVATQSGLSDKRKRFGIFHEIGHFILPEHRSKLFLDDDATLSWWAKVQIEREANEIAAEILFQGNRFTEEALSSPTSVRTVTDLAPRYGASYESAIRRYTERHVLPCAVVVLDKVQKVHHDSEESEFDDSEYKIHYTITSPAFRKKYFSALEIRGGTIKGSELCGKARWWGVDDIVEHRMIIRDWHFETEIFSNGYKIFQFVLPPKTAVRT
jgi:Zn-dependent peptidase ImmA (M78 family)